MDDDEANANEIKAIRDQISIYRQDITFIESEITRLLERISELTDARVAHIRHSGTRQLVL